jgi:hypothetical protein
MLIHLLLFDRENLIKLAKFYPKDFSMTDLRCLSFQFGSFVIDVRSDERFSTMKNIVDISVLLVETNMHFRYSFVYKLQKLVLLLPVTTTSVERALLAMNFVKQVNKQHGGTILE